MAGKDIRVNRQIRVPQIFLIDEKGEKKGVVSTREALELADNVGLDLVEVSPNARPPVCKILDYGKYRYETQKKLREAKKNQTIIKTKEIRMQVKVDVGDLKTKARFISEFLSEGNKVKRSVRFRGREMQHIEIGQIVLDKVLALLDEQSISYQIEQSPTMEGRMLSMLIAPSTNSTKKPQKISVEQQISKAPITESL